MTYRLKDLKENYEIEIEKITEKIKNSSAKRILLQFPEGLKPYAVPITDYIQEKTKAEIHIWLADCFGACDIPQTEADLLIQFGHAPWDKKFDGTSIDSKNLSLTSL